MANPIDLRGRFKVYSSPCVNSMISALENDIVLHSLKFILIEHVIKLNLELRQ